MDSLWKRVEITEEDKSPRSILEEQVVEFNKLYPNILEASVDSQRSTDASRPFRFTMQIYAPKLVYSYQVLDLFCPTDFYPLIIRVDPELYFYDDRHYFDDVYEGYIVAENQEIYVDHLRIIFQSQKITDIIKSILIQVREMATVDEESSFPF